MSAIALDPLIAEAKRRAHRRYLIMLAALVRAALFGELPGHLRHRPVGLEAADGEDGHDAADSGADELPLWPDG